MRWAEDVHGRAASEYRVHRRRERLWRIETMRDSSPTWSQAPGERPFGRGSDGPHPGRRGCIRSRDTPMNFERFCSSKAPTLGVELELQLVDVQSMELRDGLDEVLNAIPQGMRDAVKPEFYCSCIEVNTGICR